MIKNAKKSVIIMTTDTGFVKKAESLKNALKKAKDNGVKIKILAPINKNNKASLSILSKYGQIRSNSDFSARFCVVDNKNVVFMVLDDKMTHPNYDFGVWVKTDFFAKGFVNIFDNFWNRSKPTK
jgi:sugar-specific transcriptional regulator TrmB